MHEGCYAPKDTPKIENEHYPLNARRKTRLVNATVQEAEKTNGSRNQKNARDEIGAGIGSTTRSRYGVTKGVSPGQQLDGVAELLWLGDKSPPAAHNTLSILEERLKGLSLDRDSIDSGRAKTRFKDVLYSKVGHD